MDVAWAWVSGSAGVVIVLISVYFFAVFRVLQNKRVIGSAIEAMLTSLAGPPAPQRALLNDVAGNLAAQERAVLGVEAALRELAERGDEPPTAEELLKELLDLAEPQRFVADFLTKYGGGGGSERAFDSIAASLLSAATGEVFGDMAKERPVELDRLLLLAADGVIAPVALAGIAAYLEPDAPPCQAPAAADRDPAGIAAIAGELDRASRRQLRLATLIHGQAEAMMRLSWRGPRRPAMIWARIKQLMRFPLPRQPDFGPGDLAALASAFDAVGEIIDMAAEHLAENEPGRAIHLLAGVRLPVPAGLPGRMLHQESLAQVRPLAEFVIWHRLAVSRWAASVLVTLTPDGDQ